MDSTLTDFVEALVGALDDGRADDARALCAPAAWEALAPLCGDATLALQAFPGMLEARDRAAVRLIGFYQDGRRDSWWLLALKGDDGYTCVGTGKGPLDARAFLHDAAAEAVPDAPPDPLADLPAELRDVVEQLGRALHEGDVEAARGLCRPDAWEAPDHAPSRLATRAAGPPHVSRTAGRRPLRPEIVFGDARVRDDRAAVRVGMLLGERGAGDAWLAFEQDAAGGWWWIAAATTWEPVGLFVLGRTDAVPVFAALPADAAAARWGKAVVDAAGPIDGIDADTWAELTARPAGRTLAPGAVRVLPAVDRACVEFTAANPDDALDREARWAVLERASATAPWTLRAVSHAGGLSTLLDGVDVRWGAPEEPPKATTDMRDAVRRTVMDALKANGVAPEMVEGLADLPPEQLEAVLPQLVGAGFAALAGGLLGKLKESLDEAAARDPDVTVDLERERAKRAGTAGPEPSPFERDVAKGMRDALRGALAGAAEGKREVKVDREFLNTHGSAILGTLFGAVAKAVVPAEVTVDVPRKDAAGEGGADDVTTVKLPLGELLGKLFEQAARPAPGAPEEPPEEES